VGQRAVEQGKVAELVTQPRLQPVQGGRPLLVHGP
jgi:hypothetical protein